ncbi:MAG: DUF3093 family protein [Actinobacteria bacterium]|uniref:Unannotated protein n=1 Tax=freshwater metagenome TaxID=449393 RepID=A0A6J7D8V7_9ZZZZ|nr:DUF3093 family protein [Actinomycetota bacterium]
MRYREVIRMPLWLLAIIYFFLLSLVLSIGAALGNTAAIVSLLATTALLVLIALKSALRIEINDEELRVGRAHIELKFVSSIQTLTASEMASLRTRDANPAAFLAIRFWSPAGVRVVINDSRDSTPYWLVTSKNPRALIKALELN